MKKLENNFGPARQPLALCNWVCPNRSWLRVLVQALAALLIVAIPSTLYNPTAGGWYKGSAIYRVSLWTSGMIFAVLLVAMNECDPALAALRENNSLLIAMGVLLLVSGLYKALRWRALRRFRH